MPGINPKAGHMTLLFRHMDSENVPFYLIDSVERHIL
jgi:hypothetical protein